MFKNGVLQFVQKPYDPENVLRIVRDILDMKK
jgi:DNA-binding NtrC family response regulator